MNPAQQRLVADDAATFRLDARLQVELEFTPLQGDFQIDFERPALLDQLVHATLERAAGVPAGILGMVERHVGAADQRIHVLGMFGA